MSTILNALRRLEEDVSTEESQPTNSLPATDPRSTDELRSRILEEEQAAIARVEQHSQNLMTQPLPRALAAAALLLVGISVSVFVIAPRFTSLDSHIPPSAESADLSVVAASPTHQPENIVAANPPSVANRPALPPTSKSGRQSSNESHLANAAVTPTPSTPSTPSTPVVHEPTGAIQPDTAPVLAAEIAPTPSFQPSLASPTLPDSRRDGVEGDRDLASSRSSSPPRAKQARPAPSLNLARTASVAAAPISNSSTGTPIDALPIVDESTAANPIDHSIRTEIRAQAESPVESEAGRAPETNLDRTPERSVQQHIAPSTPDIAVLQTAWHPTSDHRSAKIRLLESDETLTLREGDAVGRLVVQQITPSAVIFLSGDIELRLRVGQPH